MTYDLNEGERIMIRRALALYGQLFLKQKADAVAAKKLTLPRQHARYNDEIRYATERLGAIDQLSEKILKEGHHDHT